MPRIRTRSARAVHGSPESCALKRGWMMERGRVRWMLQSKILPRGPFLLQFLVFQFLVWDVFQFLVHCFTALDSRKHQTRIQTYLVEVGNQNFTEFLYSKIQ